MQKRIIAITLSVAMVLCSSVSVFAADGETNKPFSSSFIEYWYTGSQIQSTSGTMSTWGQIITSITDSIARSIQSLKTAIVSLIDGVETNQSTANNYLNTLVSYLTYSNNTAGHSLYNIDVNSLYIYDKLSDLYDLIDAGGLVDEVKIKDNTSNGFSQAYFWAKWLKGSSVQLNTINANGDLNASNRFDFGSNSILGGIEAILYYYGNGLVTSASRITQHVVDTSYATDDYLYDTDLVGTNMAKDSLWANVRDIGSNLSMHLSRLDYVLASDDEIAARQAAEDNQNAFVDNFLDGSGSGSASTSDLGDMADGSAAIKAAFSSNASATDAFNILSGDGDVWDWFTQGTKDSFDNVANTRSSAEYTDYYQAYMDQVYKGVNEDNDSR